MAIGNVDIFWFLQQTKNKLKQEREAWNGWRALLNKEVAWNQQGNYACGRMSIPPAMGMTN